MKIQCNACGAAEAAVLCCADEAALCAACDEEVHAANRLAGKHQRVPLLPDAATHAASAPPKCDICQEASGYFFCLEDRALLCRDCDVAIHTVNSFVSAHQRFLLTGVQVGLEPADPVPPIADKHVNTSGGTVDSQQKHLANKNPTALFSGESGVSIPSQNAASGDYSRQISAPNTKTAMVKWPMDNSAVRLAEPQPKYLSNGSSKHLLSSQTTAALSNQMNRDSDPAYNLPFSGGNGSSGLPDWTVTIHGWCLRFPRHQQPQASAGKRTCITLCTTMPCSSQKFPPCRAPRTTMHLPASSAEGESFEQPQQQAHGI